MPTPPPSPEPSRRAHTRAGPGLVLAALGVVFGDIGTSPLYTLNECIGGEHGAPATAAGVLGVASMIVWSLVLVVSVKYLLVLMRADNEGEGGIMALLALTPERLRGSAPGKVGLVSVLVIAGAALLFGDGMITPAISVLSAVEGVGVATPALKPLVVPATVVILLALFAVQRWGTGGLGRLFGPVMLVWFVMIAAFGARALAARPEVLFALSPVYAVRFFVDHGFHGFRVLGGVVLAVTGGEALYADMGHFGRRPIRIAWLAIVFPSLVICYLGQGAMLVGDPSLVDRPFYAMVPFQGPLLYVVVVVATLATVIASQALITGVFSLTHQAIRLGFFPRLRVEHTSGEAEGQIYVPLLNAWLAVSCVILVIVFRESSRLAAAFGLAVSGTMLITSMVFYVVTREHWGWSRWRAVPLLVFFLAIDVPFVAANLFKFLDGGYVPFAVGAVFVAIMMSWRIGRSLLAAHFREHATSLDAYLERLSALHRVPGVAVMMSSDPTGAPAVLATLATRLQVAHETLILLTVSTEHVPTVPDASRTKLESLGAGVHRLVVRYGFMDVPDVPQALASVLPAIGVSPDVLPLYVLGRETIRPGPGGQMSRPNEHLFALLSRNARTATDYFRIPPGQVLELGTQVDL